MKNETFKSYLSGLSAMDKIDFSRGKLQDKSRDLVLRYHPSARKMAPGIAAN